MLCQIDLVARKQRIPVLRHAALPREIQQQGHGFGIKKAFGGIHKDMGRCQAERIKPLTIGRKSGAQVKRLAGCRVMSPQCLPCGGAVAAGACQPNSHVLGRQQNLLEFDRVGRKSAYAFGQFFCPHGIGIQGIAEARFVKINRGEVEPTRCFSV